MARSHYSGRAAGRSQTATYSVQQHGHCAVSIEGSLVTPQLGDLANEHDDAPDKVVEVRGGDARGRELFSHACVWFAGGEQGVLRWRDFRRLAVVINVEPKGSRVESGNEEVGRSVSRR